MISWTFYMFGGLNMTTHITTSTSTSRLDMRNLLLIFFKRVVFPTPPIPYILLVPTCHLEAISRPQEKVNLSPLSYQKASQTLEN